MPENTFKFWSLKEKNSVRYLSFEKWKGIKVYYSTRIGGVSKPPFDSLNLYLGRGDKTENVKTNRKRLFEALGIKERDVVFTRQIHSDIVNVVKNRKELLVGDAMITKRKGVFLGVFTADCTAVFLHSSEFPVIGVIHAGRKGGEKNITGKVVDKICKTYDLEPDKIEALFGPCIGPTHYEVGRDFENRFSREFLIKKEKRLYLDMWKMLKKQLNDKGIKRVFVPEICSFKRSDLFFSYRKSGAKVGENLGIIGMEM